MRLKFSRHQEVYVVTSTKDVALCAVPNDFYAHLTLCITSKGKETNSNTAKHSTRTMHVRNTSNENTHNNKPILKPMYHTIG